MADETKENTAKDSPAPTDACLHHDAKTHKRCENARLAGRVYCEVHKSEGGGGGGSGKYICYIEQ